MSEINELLIELVRQYSYLYDSNDPEYKDVVKRAETWKDIADKLQQSTDAVKMRWKNLRDSYVKYIKHLNGATGLAKKYKNWPWATHMEFLKDSVHPRPFVSSVPDLCKREFFDEFEDTKNSDPAINYSSEMPPPKKKLKPWKKSNEVGVDNILQLLQRKTDNEATPHFDHIDHLFLGYADTLKRLLPRTQALLKMELAQIFGHAELADIGSNSPPFSPSSNSNDV